MPTVRGGHQTPRRGYQTATEIKKTHNPAMARDDLSEAFAGYENEGPFGDKKADSLRSTNVKSRKTAKSKTKTPVR